MNPAENKRILEAIFAETVKGNGRLRSRMKAL